METKGAPYLRRLFPCPFFHLWCDKNQEWCRKPDEIVDATISIVKMIIAGHFIFMRPSLYQAVNITLEFRCACVMERHCENVFAGERVLQSGVSRENTNQLFEETAQVHQALSGRLGTVSNPIVWIAIHAEAGQFLLLVL